MRRIQAERNAPPRAQSSYYFPDLDPSIPALISALLHSSPPDRTVTFTTCVTYHSGDLTLQDYGSVEVPVAFYKPERAYVSVSHAIDAVAKKVGDQLGWQYLGWMTQGRSKIPSTKHTGSSKLRDRVLRDARVLPNSIIDVSKFMDSLVDVSLMDECGLELSSR